MRLSRVVGMPVVDTHVARQAGIISEVLVDLEAGRVAVLNVQHADGWLVQRIPAEYVYRVGPHTALVSDSVAVDVGPPLSSSRWLPLERLLGLEVMSDGGERVGRVADVDVDEQTLLVRAYLLRGAQGAWRGRGRGQVTPDEVVSFSPELMLVRAR